MSPARIPRGAIFIVDAGRGSICHSPPTEPIINLSAVFTEDTVLDLNGHFIGGISSTALLLANGCRVELRNSGPDVTLRTNTA